jgi:hypothetical protein
MNREDMKKMFAHPIYCLAEVPGWRIKGGVAMISKEKWKLAVSRCIEEIGLDEWLDLLLENLEEKDSINHMPNVEETKGEDIDSL